MAKNIWKYTFRFLEMVPIFEVLFMELIWHISGELIMYKILRGRWIWSVCFAPPFVRFFSVKMQWNGSELVYSATLERIIFLSHSYFHQPFGRWWWWRTSNTCRSANTKIQHLQSAHINVQAPGYLEQILHRSEGS